MLYHGAMGVDLFFILSGFLMVYTTRTLPGGVADARVFLLKRIVRIWPAYAVLTGLTFLTLQGVHGLVEPAGREALLKTLLFVPVDPYNPLYFSMALPVGWTLTFEMYFYVVFAAQSDIPLVCSYFHLFSGVDHLSVAVDAGVAPCTASAPADSL